MSLKVQDSRKRRSREGKVVKVSFLSLIGQLGLRGARKAVAQAADLHIPPPCQPLSYSSPPCLNTPVTDNYSSLLSTSPSSSLSHQVCQSICASPCIFLHPFACPVNLWQISSIFIPHFSFTSPFLSTIFPSSPFPLPPSLFLSHSRHLSLLSTLNEMRLQQH